MRDAVGLIEMLWVTIKCGEKFSLSFGNKFFSSTPADRTKQYIKLSIMKFKI